VSENVELVRRIYEEHLLDGDPERFAALVTDDVEYVNPPDAVEPGVRRGVADVAEALRNASEFFSSYRFELHELFNAGDFVVASVSCYARSRGSETEIFQEEVHTWTLRGGRIARFEWGRDLRAALEAVGLRA
jgi:ketosteroid isomerase-like protein